MGLDFPLNFQGLEETILPGMLGADLLQLLTPSPLAPTEKEGQVLRNIPSLTNLNFFAQQIQVRPALSSTTPYSRGTPSPPALHTQRVGKDPVRTRQEGKARTAHTKPLQTPQTQGFTPPELIQTLVSPGSSLDLSFPCDISLIHPLST